jgi:hypothetical protein
MLLYPGIVGTTVACNRGPVRGLRAGKRLKRHASLSLGSALVARSFSKSSSESARALFLLARSDSESAGRPPMSLSEGDLPRISLLNRHLQTVQRNSSCPERNRMQTSRGNATLRDFGLSTSRRARQRWTGISQQQGTSTAAKNDRSSNKPF